MNRLKRFGTLAIAFAGLVAIALQPIAARADEEEPPISASRRPDEEWTVYVPELLAKGSPLARAKRYGSGIDVSALPVWTDGEDALQEAFENARDERIYIQSGRPKFKRRSTWLYPDDGCFARAAHVTASFRRKKLLVPGKVFAFGHLRLQTKYSAKGKVFWWFHTAAAIRHRGETLVLDPSVEPGHPISLGKWLDRISKDADDVEVSACDSHAYGPKVHLCIGGSSKQERSAVSSQISFLDNEWSRIVNLGLSPTKLLGDDPPWKQSLEDQESEPLNNANP